MRKIQKIASWEDFIAICAAAKHPKLSILTEADRPIVECILKAVADANLGWSALSNANNQMRFGDSHRFLGGLKSTALQSHGLCMYWNRGSYSDLEPVGIDWLKKSKGNDEAPWTIESAVDFATAIRKLIPTSNGISEENSKATPPVPASLQDSAIDWANKHPRHKFLREQNTGLHDLLHMLAKHVISHRTSSSLRLQLESPKSDQAAWSMGLPSELGSFHLYGLFQESFPRVSVCCVIEEQEGPEFEAAGFKFGRRQAFKALAKKGLCAVQFSVAKFEEALPCLQKLEEFDYLLPSSINFEDALSAGMLPKKEAERRHMVRDEFVRDSLVREAVLREAKGLCALCAKKAFFKTADGQEFLHVHHIIELSNGGSDTFDNCVALHADCHAKAHYARPLERENVREFLLRFRRNHPEVQLN